MRDLFVPTTAAFAVVIREHLWAILTHYSPGESRCGYGIARVSYLSHEDEESSAMACRSMEHCVLHFSSTCASVHASGKSTSRCFRQSVYNHAFVPVFDNHRRHLTVDFVGHFDVEPTVNSGTKSNALHGSTPPSPFAPAPEEALDLWSPPRDHGRWRTRSRRVLWWID
jgi:hypothetical protein